jgi:hypothetical protein
MISLILHYDICYLDTICQSGRVARQYARGGHHHKQGTYIVPPAALQARNSHLQHNHIMDRISYETSASQHARQAVDSCAY